jgi:cytochrome P450
MTTETTETLRPEEFFEFIALPERRADPYPFFARARSLAPAFPVGDIWLLSSYDFVSSILRDPRFSTDERKSNLNEQAQIDEFHESAFGRLYFNMLLFIDDPDHKRIRDLVQKAFTRKTVEDLRGRVGLLVDELVDGLIERGGGDLISEVAYPLPIIVICELLGVPPEDRHVFGDKAVDFARRFEIQPLRSPEDEQRGDVATTYFVDYFDRLIEEKRSNPGDDLLSSLVAVEDQGDVLTHDELLGTCLLILFAGHETTANLIGNGTYALMRNRDQWDRLVAEPGLARSAVEELLRYDTPVQIIMRVSMEDVAFGDQTIPAKTQIGVMLGAANRDPAHFPDPDRLDITREQAALTAFGGGIHFCLGAPLARLEAQVMFNTLARRVPDLRVDGEVTWRPSFVIRGVEALPVTTG